MHKLLMMMLIPMVFARCSTRMPPTVSPTHIAAPIQTKSAATPAVPAQTRPATSPSPQPIRATATPTADPNLLMPDLQTLPPSDLVIEIAPQAEPKLLRFTNSIVNGGPGALELLGVFDPTTGQTAVTQHIYSVDGSIAEHAAGEFVFHPGHDHWHFENFARFEVWSLTSEGDLDAVVALTDKVSYCIRDNTRADIPGASPRPAYTRCGRELQGIAAGWIDTYEFDTPGQIVDITDVPDGVYALRSTVDPDNYLLEKDDTNNAAAVYIEINDDRVRIIERSSLPNPLLIPDNQ